MSKKSIYHFSKEGTTHKGHSWDCSACKRHSLKKTKKEKCQVSGKNGGKKAAATVHAARKCACGAKIHRDNKSGMCITCLNKSRRIEKEKLTLPKVGPRYCKTVGCNNKLSHGNTSGLCAKCYSKSDKRRQHSQEHSNWIRSAVFSQDVKPIPKSVLSE